LTKSLRRIRIASAHILSVVLLGHLPRPTAPQRTESSSSACCTRQEPEPIFGQATLPASLCDLEQAKSGLHPA